MVLPWLCVAPLAGQGLQPPSLRCASVEPNGDVAVTWVAPDDPGNLFGSYELYHAPDEGGPYMLLASLANINTLDYLHAAPGGGPHYYYLLAHTNAVPPVISAPSDTLATIFLEVSQSAPLGSALLSWNLPAEPMLPTAGDEFEVWMEYPQGIWTVIGQDPNDRTEHEHVISICEDTLTFRVSLTDASGCISFSSLDGDVFTDDTPPSSPVLVFASVDTTTGTATLQWEPSPEGDTDGYIILLNQGGGNVILDTVYGQFTDTYTWLLSDAGAGPESFTVAAFDTCYTGMPPSPNTSATLPPHTTIHVSTVYDRCAAEIGVNWTPYGGWPVQSYEVFVRIDGGPWAQFGIFGPDVNAVLQEDVQPFRTYCYLVKALGGGPGIESLSNFGCRISDYPAVPQFNYLRTVTVLGDDRIRIVDSTDASGQVSRYRLERSANGEPFEEVATAPGTAGPLIVFTDEDVEADRLGYMYRVLVEDSCGTETLISNIGTSVLLRAEPRLEGVNDLIWNGYSDWAGMVQSYRVYRSLDDGPFDLLTATAPDIWSFSDDVAQYDELGGRFCYYVEAVEVGNPSGYNAISRSNIACAVQPEQVWIPNAFIVGGINNTFIPVTAYADLSRYEFTIINRWGQVVWTTEDPDEPWRGEVDGVMSPQGVYAYFCSFRNGAGRTIEKRGTVTLLYAVE